jgi:regulator of RNase E activity RraA
MDESVGFAGVTVHPEDAAPADRNGVAFIPAAHLERVLELAAWASGG